MNIANVKPGRQVLLSLLTGIHLSAAPLYIGMPPAIIFLVIALSLWQFTIIKQHKNNPSKPVQFFVILITLSIILLSYGHILGQQPGIALIILMTILKLFETKSMRDCYIIVYSSIFIIASNFFQSQSIWLILYVFFIVIYLLSILIAASDRLHSIRPAVRFKLASQFIVMAAPVMLILFILFPRIPGPLWGLPADAFSGKTGLSEEMSPGSINRLISSSAIAFRVKFNTDIPPHNQLYWRGAVLPLYDGKTWKRQDAPENTKPNIHYQTKTEHTYDYVLTLEPTNLNWLLSLEYAASHSPEYRFNREAMLITQNKINSVTSYKIKSQTNAVNQSLFPQEDYKNRLLPAGLNPRTHKLASQLLQTSGYDINKYINNVLTYYRQNEFIYTLNPDLLGTDAMDDFLFNSRRGFCEHYTSAFVYLMRAAGIPSRVVIGYQGGTMNPLDDYMIVRQSDAHAWAEVWTGSQWLRVDPTAAVSPDRIEQGVLNSGLEQNRLPLLLISNSSFIKNFAYLYDSFQNSWNQWVIGFDQKKQNDFLKWLGFDQATSSNLILLLVLCLSLAGLAIAWLTLRQTTDASERVQHYYYLFCRKLQRYGIERKLNEGPVDLENRIRRDRAISTASKKDVRFIFNAYRELHYGNKNNSSLAESYIKKIKTFKLRKTKK